MRRIIHERKPISVRVKYNKSINRMSKAIMSLHHTSGIIGAGEKNTEKNTRISKHHVHNLSFEPKPRSLEKQEISRKKRKRVIQLNAGYP